MNEIEVIARGVCVVDDKLLLCHSKGAPNTYLPGGHVEFEESAAFSLVREIEEEMGLAAQVGRFLGAVEHTFIQKGKRHCELNLVFEFAVPGLDPRETPPSEEAHIEFLWCDLASLSDSAMEPFPLRKSLARWRESDDGNGSWESTYE